MDPEVSSFPSRPHSAAMRGTVHDGAYATRREVRTEGGAVGVVRLRLAEGGYRRHLGGQVGIDYPDELLDR
jgi:hypothetical protein